MKSRKATAERIENSGIIAVIRAPSRESVIPLGKALIAGGVDILEITMSTPQAIEAIRDASGTFGDSALIGVGTILDEATAVSAMDAGACFVVTPILRPELVPVCHDRECPVMLGAYTPTEAQKAHEAGADFVKIFPADTLGPGYIRSLRAPMPHLRIVPTGGVTESTVKDFLDAGCHALGAGSSLVSGTHIKNGEWSKITESAQAFRSALLEWRRSKAG